MNITNNIIASYIYGLYDNSNKQLLQLREFATENRIPIIMKDTEELLRALMKLKKPARVLEIGAAVGYSACVFTDCCGCDVTTIESDKSMAEVAESNIRMLGFSERINVIRGDARNVLRHPKGENIAGDGGMFDAVFIDAAKSHYKEFWDLCVPLVNEDGLIICDNVLMRGMTASETFDTKKRYKTSIRNMREFLLYIKQLDYADTAVLPVGDGVSISTIEKKHEKI